MSFKKNTDSFRFALFASLLCAIYKAVLCIMRRFSGDDKINATVAGVLSALSILIDNKNRRVFLALVIFSRALVNLTDILFKYRMYS